MGALPPPSRAFQWGFGECIGAYQTGSDERLLQAGCTRGSHSACLTWRCAAVGLEGRLTLGSTGNQEKRSPLPAELTSGQSATHSHDPSTTGACPAAVPWAPAGSAGRAGRPCRDCTTWTRTPARPWCRSTASGVARCAGSALYTRRQRLLQPEDLQHVLVDDVHGLLYCYVPKVACTNWKRVLLALSGHARGDPRAIPAHEAHAPGRLPSLADFSPAEINRRLRSYLAFLFVREPFERLASAYRNKLARPYSAAFQRRYGTRIVRRLRPRAHPDALARGHDVRFAEFLAFLLDPRTRREEPFNEHWERAHALCHPCRLRYDVVGKFETLAEDAAFVLGLAGAPDVRFPAAPSRPRAASAREQAARLFQDISPFYQRRLFDLYKLDFLLFNYSAPAALRLR
ncbi:carbohydrate sulfotransferase 13 [Tupaia chinensis]|uniref:carbohydrate sulfotransferase 13 n=1 Tax=Tupaia chinensis TaxID=246437 RepID=UPI000FFBC264|nr:carbohydrate sulfotransferase 13 [Tupaia chinensis]